MKTTALKLVKRVLALSLAALVALIAWRAYDALRAPHLERWHTFAPHEASAEQIAQLDWAGYVQQENRLFDEVRSEVTDQLEPEDQVESNRYYSASPIYPGRFETDWNRSYLMKPSGTPVGAVVLLHGLTDSPYSLRHVARRYVQEGFVAVAIRLPGHRLASPERIVLFAPMIGITSMARFAGVFGWPAFFPAFDKAAWLGIVPEFNPFKYNSFPVNGARQSSLVARRLQAQIDRHAREDNLKGLPPVLTFQSVVDFTVSTPAIPTALYSLLPDNGSELVLFDLNRNARFGPLLRANADTVLTRLLPDPPRNFATTIVTNVGPHSDQVVARSIAAGSTEETVRQLNMVFPPGVFSLSHLAIPFPLDDPLYGLQPDTREDYGANLGAMATRGERGLLIVSIDSLARMSSNPFFDFLMERVEQGIKTRPAPAKP